MRPGIAQAADVAAAVAGQEHLDVVLSVLRKGVRHDHAAPRADRQPRHVRFLRGVRGHANHGALDGLLLRADGQPADLARRRDVAVQQRRREIPHRHVVETVSALVRQQQRGGVDVQRQQITDRVLIFRAVETPEGLGPARVRIRLRRGIERRLQPLEHRLTGLAGRLRPIGRRHGAGAQLLHHLFPRLGALGDVQRIDFLQGETRSLEPVVVAGHAVAVEQLTAVGRTGRHLGCRRRDGARRRRSRPLCGEFGGQTRRRRQDQPRVQDSDPGDALPHAVSHPRIVGFDPVKFKEEVTSPDCSCPDVERSGIGREAHRCTLVFIPLSVRRQIAERPRPAAETTAGQVAELVGIRDRRGQTHPPSRRPRQVASVGVYLASPVRSCAR